MRKLQTALTIAAFAGAAAWAQSPLSSNSTTPLIGVTTGESIQLNVTRPESTGPILPTRCSGVLSIRDMNGQVLKTQQFLDIAPGQSASVLVNRDTDVNPSTQRVELRGVISSLGDEQAPPLCTLAVSLEVLDNATGRTLSVITNVTPSRLRPNF